MFNFFEFTLYLEGQAEDFVKQNPQLQPAYNAGINNVNYLRWIVKQKEPIEDTIPLVQFFIKNKNHPNLKNVDINKYDSNNLRLLTNNLNNKSQEGRRLKEEETTKIGAFGDWTVVMPHSRESSCQWGKDTTWCTAATQSGNLFYSYVGRKDQNVVLYYIIKKNSDARVDPNTKLSLGFLNGKIQFGQDGWLTVNAKNKGLNQNDLVEILGNQYNPIIQALNKHNLYLQGMHPAKNKMQEIAQSNNPEILKNHIKNMSKEEESDFLDQLVNYGLSKENAKYLLDEKKSNKNVLYTSIVSSQNPTETMSYFGKEYLLNKLTNDDIYQLISSSKNPVEIMSFFGKENILDSYIYHLISDSQNPVEIMSFFGKENILNKLKNYEIYHLISNHKPLPITGRNPFTPQAQQTQSHDNWGIQQIIDVMNFFGKEYLLNKLDDSQIYYFISNSKNPVEIMSFFGKENILNKLKDSKIYSLISDSQNPVEIMSFFGKEYFLNKYYPIIHNFITYSRNRIEVMDFFGKEYLLNKLKDDEIYDLIKNSQSLEKQKMINFFGAENLLNKLGKDLYDQLGIY